MGEGLEAKEFLASMGVHAFLKGRQLKCFNIRASFVKSESKLARDACLLFTSTIDHSQTGVSPHSFRLLYSLTRYIPRYLTCIIQEGTQKCDSQLDWALLDGTLLAPIQHQNSHIHNQHPASHEGLFLVPSFPFTFPFHPFPCILLY